MKIRKVVAATVSLAVQIVLFPLFICGYALFAASAFRFGRKTGASITALGPLFLRWMQHKLDLRHDDACDKLTLVLPGVSHSGLWMVSAPTLVAYRLTDIVPKVYRYPYPDHGNIPISHHATARTSYFDSAIDHHRVNVRQLVILGAGYDTRAYRQPAGVPLRCFEVDRPQTQTRKCEMIAMAGVDTSNVTFVSADFLRENWFNRLLEAGFDRSQPTFFLWEGVMMYLDRVAVESTLRTFAGSAIGSVVAFDYFSSEHLASQPLSMRIARSGLKVSGESLRFGIPTSPSPNLKVAAFLAANGLTMERQRDIARDPGGRFALAGMAIAVVK